MAHAEHADGRDDVGRSDYGAPRDPCSRCPSTFNTTTVEFDETRFTGESNAPEIVAVDVRDRDDDLRVQLRTPVRRLRLTGADGVVTFEHTNTARLREIGGPWIETALDAVGVELGGDQPWQ